MNVLTATGRTQGQRSNDYSFTIECELVRIDEACALDRQDPDGGCGCGRGFAGMSSSRATTTALVRDLPMTPAEFERAYVDALVAQGWLGADDHADADVAAEIHHAVWVLLEAAARIPVGTVLERRLDVLQSRADMGEQRQAS